MGPSCNAEVLGLILLVKKDDLQSPGQIRRSLTQSPEIQGQFQSESPLNVEFSKSPWQQVSAIAWQEDVKRVRALAQRAAESVKDRNAAKDAAALARRLSDMDSMPDEV